MESFLLNGIAWSAVIKGDFASGEKFARLGIADDSDNGPCHHALGAALMGQGKLAAAMVEFGKAIEIADHYEDAETHAAALGDRGICEWRQSFQEREELSRSHRQRAHSDLKEALEEARGSKIAGHWKEALDEVIRLQNGAGTQGGAEQLQSGSTSGAPGAAQTTMSQPLDGERFPKTRLQALAYSDVANMSYADVRYAINEMFARYGATFPQKEIQAKFDAQSWYHRRSGYSFDDIEASFFSAVERENLRLLGEARDRLRDQ